MRRVRNSWSIFPPEQKPSHLTLLEMLCSSNMSLHDICKVFQINDRKVELLKLSYIQERSQQIIQNYMLEQFKLFMLSCHPLQNQNKYCLSVLQTFLFLSISATIYLQHICKQDRQWLQGSFRKEAAGVAGKLVD